MHPLRPEPPVDPGPPPWLPDHRERPFLVVTMGTIFNRVADAFDALIHVLTDVDADVLLTTGTARDPAALGPLPEHIQAVRYAPLWPVLRAADLVISHGGSGTVLAALACGVPPLVVLLGSDQRANADLVARAGVGLTVTPPIGDSSAVTRTVHTLLDDGSYGRTATRLRTEIAVMPSSRDVVALVEQVASRRV